MKTKIVLNKFINHIEKRPKMYVSNPNFVTISSLISGYFCAINDTEDVPLNLMFSEWLNKNGEKTSLIWNEYIFSVIAKNNEEIAYFELFEKIKLFINDLND